jgi:aryl-alcohol dehydrogenase-like predicted oxidoreductase
MDYTRLGDTGLQVSRICLGMMTYGLPSSRAWALVEDDARPFVKKAVESGINFFDTADMYSEGESERITGKLLAEFAPREEVVVATKVFFPHSDKPNAGGLSRKHIMDGIERSLTNLNMDYVDLYQIHRWDYETPIEETMEALHDVVKAGKARYIGASSMWAWQFAKAQYTADLNGWTRFVSMQNHYNLMYREEEREMIPLCRDMGVGIIPWSPLARGILAGSRTRSGERKTKRSETDGLQDRLYTRDADYDVVETVQAVADEMGIKPAQLALAWLLHQPGITAPIVGASKMYQLDEALAVPEIELSDEIIERLEAPYTPQAVAGHE